MTILICVDVLVYLSGERTAFFYLILSTIAIILLIKKWRLLRIVTLSISILIIILISISNENIKVRMLDRTLEENQYFKIFYQLIKLRLVIII